MHQVAHLPHQRLVPVNHGLCGRPIVVEARRRHGLFDFAYGSFALGDPGFQFVDFRLMSLSGPLRSTSFCVRALLFGVIGLGLWR